MTLKQHHIPVLLEEAIEALQINPAGTYLDATFGRGGHARPILQQLGAQGRLYLLDRDPQAITAAQALNDHRVTAVQANFSQLADLVQQLVPGGRLDGILFDLGVSSPQLEEAERGFSFSKDGPLDMRMDPTQGVCAADWLNRASEQEIATALWRYGEERMARRIAAAIVYHRAQQPLLRTQQLALLIAAIVRYQSHKHPATRSFQAIRMVVNEELASIQQGLIAALSVLAPQGRLAVISFHSLEDRLVKQFMCQQSVSVMLPSKLPLTEVERQQRCPLPSLRSLGKYRPSKLEITNNPRARSAILRVAERLNSDVP